MIALVLAGCTCSEPAAAPEPPSVPPETPAENPLYVSPSSYDFRSNPRLLERIRGSAHGYYRFINVAFSDQVCERFQGSLGDVPTVNLHGDAHLEQYVVTTFGRGLSDYDDSSTGPSVIDLVRLGTSVRLACQARGWEGSERELLDEILRGYRGALDDPELEAPEPALARHIRDGFSNDRAAFMHWVEEITIPLPDERRERFEAAAHEYLDTMLEQEPDLGAEFFRIKSVTTHALGIGSALDEKYLMRVEGPTASPDDDVILEAKEVRDLSGIRCIRNAENMDPFRVLLGQARIAYEPYPYLGHMRFDGKSFWIHGWADNYHELDLAEIDSPDELREIAYDIGVQLGRGHVKQIAAPLDAQLRRAQRAFLDRSADEIADAVAELATLVTEAWQRFVRDSDALARSLEARAPEETH